MNWHQQKTDEVMQKLGSSTQGLSADEVRTRLQEHGPNELTESAGKTVFMMFLDQFKDFMILVLIAAAVISGIIGEATDTIAIIVIVILNAVIGFVQEFRAEKAMQQLMKMSAHSALVIREGNPVTIAATQLVPGDVVILETGGIIPADMRLIEAARLKVEEATLTGESLPTEKHVEPLSDELLSLGDRKNMVYKGTVVTYGRGTGVVAATGMGTELGKIATLLQKGEEVRTPLQKRLATFSKKLALAVLAICAVIFALGILRGEPPLLMLLTAISLAVAAIPEALPAVVTISLALGAKKMVAQNALIRKLPAVETLGSVTYVCSDKTGTLTLNKMTVEEVYAGGMLLPADKVEPGSNPELFTALALSNDANTDASGTVLGDPTEVALHAVAKLYGFDKKVLEQDFPRIAEIPFDSARKCMTTFHQLPADSPFKGAGEGSCVSFTKGAIDVLLDKATSLITGAGAAPFDGGEMETVNDRMAADGLRVLGIAMRIWESLPTDMSPEHVETELTILGLLGMMDPPREEAREAVRLCRTAGIRAVMITGDHPLTAQSIATRLGILQEGDEEVMVGRELEQLSQEEFEKRVESIRVYARVAPEQKLKIITALQDRGQFVAMTGDGVNDAPALAAADVGIAIGSGTDIAAETADIILVNSNPQDIASLVVFGKATYTKMIQNFIWATGYNVVAIPLAAGVLFSAGIIISPAIGAIFMSISTVIVAVNAQLLRRKMKEG